MSGGSGATGNSGGIGGATGSWMGGSLASQTAASAIGVLATIDGLAFIMVRSEGSGR
jgi:hypothetical protein